MGHGGPAAVACPHFLACSSGARARAPSTGHYALDSCTALIAPAGSAAAPSCGLDRTRPRTGGRRRACATRRLSACLPNRAEQSSRATGASGAPSRRRRSAPARAGRHTRGPLDLSGMHALVTVDSSAFNLHSSSTVARRLWPQARQRPSRPAPPPPQAARATGCRLSSVGHAHAIFGGVPRSRFSLQPRVASG